ncbi:MAG: hypothetical protein H0V16_04470 [Burkholderiaceae bacterium]|nr:hypothetical protein [Burkholderiaceae bacterium]
MSGGAALLPGGRFSTNQATIGWVGNGCAAAPTGFLVGNTGAGLGLGYNINAIDRLAEFHRGVVGCRR